MEKPLTIIGCGPGAPELLTAEARQAAGEATVLIGSGRLLAMFDTSAEKVDVGAGITRAIEEIAKRMDDGKVALLVSGDPGLCSLAKPVVNHFGLKRCRIIPGISSVQAAFARAGADWYGARIITAHKEDPEVDMDDLARHERIAVLAGRPEAVAWAARTARELGDRKIMLCENLTLPDEAVTEVTADGLEQREVASLAVILMIKENDQ